MNHYVYEIQFGNGMKYIGVRSCKCLPIDDVKYLGSSKAIPAEAFLDYKKNILKKFDTRIEAVQEEVRLHTKFNVKANEAYYNQVNQTTEYFDAQGNTMATHQYLRNKSVANRLAPLTPKQQEWQKARKGVLQGPNPKKANLGLAHTATKPWYYITPTFKYVEVNTSIPEFFRTAEDIPEGMTQRMVQYNVTVRAHKPAIKGPMKGFTIGRLHSKPNYINQVNLDIMLQLAVHTNVRALKDLHKAIAMGNNSNERNHNGTFKKTAQD